MQLIVPAPALRPCWVTGTIRPTMYWSLPAAFFTTLPTTRTSKEGKGPPVAVPGEVESLSARPVCPGAWVWACPFSPTVDVPTGWAYEAMMLPFASSVGKSCDHVIVFAGIWMIVLHGTVILMLLSVTVPPQSI